MPSPAGYPGFIRSRAFLTDEAEAKFSWHPYYWLRTSLSCQYQVINSSIDTDPIGGGISPGGGIVGGKTYSQIYSLNATVTPRPRLFLSANFSYQPSTTTSADNGAPEIAAYRGETYSVWANSTFALNPDTDLVAAYSFSTANFAQNNFAEGMPVGMNTSRTHWKRASPIGLEKTSARNCDTVFTITPSQPAAGPIITPHTACSPWSLIVGHDLKLAIRRRSGAKTRQEKAGFDKLPSGFAFPFVTPGVP